MKVTVPWVEGTEDDFRDLREAVGEGRTTAGKFDTGDPNSSTSEEDEEDCEPAEDEKGARLLWAAQFGRQDVLESLLEEDPDLVGFRDGDGYSALHRAAYSGRRAACAGLLSRGADVAARTEDGWTPLHSACRWNRADCAEELLASGAPVNARTCGGQTPLHLAAFCGNSSETLQVGLVVAPTVPCTNIICQPCTT